MINEKRVLAIIPARGGSKGIPRKNIRQVAGIPLIAWTITEAKKSKYIDRLILSSDDDEIISVAKEWGCEVPFKRPDELARDDTSGVDPVLHALRVLPERYDYVVLLQPTSPLRTVADIDGCIEQCVALQAVSCVTMTEPSKSPYWMYTVDVEQRMYPLLAGGKNSVRQNLPKVYVLNGAVYVMQSEWLLKTKQFVTDATVAYIMPQERSLDIDNMIDLIVAEKLLQ